MQQRFRRLALFVGAASLCAAGLIVVACSTDNGSFVATPGTDAAKGETGSETGPGTDAATDAGADCSSNPILRDNSTSFRCAFKDAGGTDAAPTCTNAQDCCNTESKTTGPGYCTTAKDGGGDNMCVAQEPAGSTFNVGKGKTWECADKSACGGGEICCMISDPARLALDPKNTVNVGNTVASDWDRYPQACGVKRVFNEGGSRCRTPVGGNCPDAKEIKLCSLTDTNCGAGTTCTPFIDFTHFIDRGYCK